MAMPPPSRRSGVDPFLVMDVLARAGRMEAAGRDVVHLEIGQPATPAPEGARRALTAAMEAGALGYTDGTGLPALRARIARHYGEAHGIDLDPARVVVTAGASGAFVLAFALLFDPGDRVGIGVPGYPSYRSILQASGVVPVPLPTGPETRFNPVPAQAEGLNGLIVASPANPTGSVLTRAEMAALAEGCHAAGCALISDEIYHGLTWEGTDTTALAVADEAIVINSFSKYFSMTGWRVGWMVVPPHLARKLEHLNQNLFICPSHAGQVAALAAMDCHEELRANRAAYLAGRGAMLAGLGRLGLPHVRPEGAFYAYADVSGLGMDSGALTDLWLDELGVAVAPGADFDPAGGGAWVRLSYAGGAGDVAEGLGRIEGWMRARN